MIRKSGNLLKYPVHSFRRKQVALPSHSWLWFMRAKKSAFSEEEADFFVCLKLTTGQRFGR
jgi:hypothetical protein